MTNQAVSPTGRVLLLGLLSGTLILATVQSPGAEPTPSNRPGLPPMGNLIPWPAYVRPAVGSFALATGAAILVEPATAEITAIGRYLADRLRPATGFPLPVLPATGDPPRSGFILTTTGGDPALGEEGYELTVAPDLVTLRAAQPAGLFRGIQTIRQLLPARLESLTAQRGPWTMPAGTIRDCPRFAWRGTMLDVARHFFRVDDVKRYIDLLAYYKMNRFHLHLTDDQGWRLMIESWPNLALIGGSTQVGGGPGGYYTQAEYAEIVAYAQSRYITVIPEIDLPGHTHAALASYAELNDGGKAPALFTGIEVGFSSLCVEKEETYKFLDDVIRELAALTPGPFIHIGGDEAAATGSEDYVKFIERAQAIVQAHGKQPIGWDEIARARLFPGTVVQHWLVDPALAGLAQEAARQGAKLIASPASKAYMDMKYTPSTPLGQSWAGCIEAKDGYDWDPAGEMPGVPEGAILGLEAPLWTETLKTLADLEFMALPRLPGYAEIGWSPANGRNWDGYKVRLGAHAPRWTAMGVNFYRSGQVPWEMEK